MDIFNRLLAKNIQPPGWTPNVHMDIKPEQIQSHREQWGIEEFIQLPRGHVELAGPRTRFDGPVIVVQYQGLRLLDGNHRINTWIARKDRAPHAVHIHTIDVVGGFVLLAPAR